MDLEQLFPRFRTRGDSAALAEVFDRAEPEVLRVAFHLSRDPAGADDLPRQTFITAIERARTFDPRLRLREDLQPLAPHEDVKVVGVAHEANLPPLQLPVEFVENDVRPAWRPPALRGPVVHGHPHGNTTFAFSIRRYEVEDAPIVRPTTSRGPEETTPSSRQ